MDAVLEHSFPDEPFGLNAFLVLTRTQTFPTPLRARAHVFAAVVSRTFYTPLRARVLCQMLANAEWKQHAGTAETGEIE
jgi:hypothetical protein